MLPIAGISDLEVHHQMNHKKGRIQSPKRFYVHECYKPTNEHQHFDIALGELSISLDLSKSINNKLFDNRFDVQPICVGKNSHRERNVYVAGWGKTGMLNFCITDKFGSR